MKFTSIAALAALAATVQAQNATDFPTQLLAALQGAGLTTLADTITTLSNTTQGAALIAGLPNGNLTILAPTNGAFQGVPADVAANTTLLTEILSYHVLNGTFDINNLATAPRHTIGRTALTAPEYARLPNMRSQAIVLSKNSNGTGVGNDPQSTNNLDNGNVTASINVYSNLRNVTSDGVPLIFRNILILPVGEVINLPPTLSAVATDAAPAVAGLLTNAGLVGPLESLRGLTIFVPNDAAVNEVQQAVAGLNESQVTTVLQNHAINNTVAYSTTLSNATQAFSLAGEAFSFNVNSTGVFVTSGDVTARVVQSDIILTNGVAHVIDRVLVNVQQNPTVVQSITSVVATATATVTQTEDAGVGAPTAGVTTTGGNGQVGVAPSSSVIPNAANKLQAGLGVGFLGTLLAFLI